MEIFFVAMGLLLGTGIGILIAQTLYVRKNQELLGCLVMIYQYASEDDKFEVHKRETSPVAATFNIMQWLRRVAPR